MKYVVVDTETTGLHPSKGDQVLTMCLYIVDTESRHGWQVLPYAFRPRNSVRFMRKGTGPVFVHGIKRKQARSAKRTFAEQAAEIAAVLKECDVFVAHNVAFDYGFLHAEFERAGVRSPLADALCTGRMAAEMLEDPKGYTSLKKACEGLFIKQVQHHDAMDDTRCAAEILRHWLYWKSTGSKGWEEL